MAQKKKKKGGALLAPLLCLAVGVVGGLLIARSDLLVDAPLRSVILVAIMLGSLYAQILLHESGHLVAGLLSGYRFSSFRIGSVMLLKTKSGLHFKRLQLSGTAGQCLMSPPDLQDGKYPFVLYNLGGVLMNLLTAAICIILLLVTENPYATAVFVFLAAMGLISAVMNGVPMSTALVTNDGYNALHLGKDATAAKSLWVQLQVNALQTEGQRIGTMDESWFDVPQDADVQNAMVTALLVFGENRSMDLHDFAKAREQIDFLLSDRCKVVGVYKNLLLLDLLYLDILQGDADVSVLQDKALKSFMKSMKNFPTVIRTRYAVAVYTGDEKAQAQALRDFEACKKSYPAEADICAEAELMQLVKG